jgi:beta-N-acetylhexosaminidase
LAPVVDLRLPGSIVGERCLAETAEQVSRLGAAFIEEVAKKHILTCAKHFPGLGAAKVDPHFGLPRVDRTKRQLQEEDAAAFVKLFNRADLVMISHAHYPGLGDEKPLPASISSRVVSGFLRKKLGYQGLTITDDLTMGAITTVGLTPELFLKAFEAGNDLLLFSQTTPLVSDAFNLIVSAARKSATLRRRVDESVQRILTLKSRTEFIPLQYRAHLKARITRHIEKLRKSVVEVGTRALTL